MRVICITGADGTGKSTLVNLLKKELRGSKEAGIWDLMKKPNAGIPFRSGEQVDIYLSELDADARLLFMSHALLQSVRAAAAQKPEFLILNAYIYKYFASEKALGASPSLIEDLSRMFIKPEIIFRLNLRPEQAAERKERLSRYECGLSKTPNKLSFVNFQYMIAENQSFFGAENIVDLQSTQKPEELVQAVLSVIHS